MTRETTINNKEGKIYRVIVATQSNSNVVEGQGKKGVTAASLNGVS